VASHPEFLWAYVLVSGTDVVLEVLVADRRQLLHLVALRIVLANFSGIGDDVVEI
jgi:hypothetical protein